MLRAAASRISNRVSQATSRTGQQHQMSSGSRATNVEREVQKQTRRTTPIPQNGIDAQRSKLQEWTWEWDAGYVG